MYSMYIIKFIQSHSRQFATTLVRKPNRARLTKFAPTEVIGSNRYIVSGVRSV